MRRPSAPLTVKSGFTTPLEEEDLAIEAVPVGWKIVVVSALTYASSSSSVCAWANVPKGPSTRDWNAGADTKRLMFLIASTMAKISKSVESMLGSIAGASKGLLELILMLPPVRIHVSEIVAEVMSIKHTRSRADEDEDNGHKASSGWARCDGAEEHIGEDQLPVRRVGSSGGVGLGLEDGRIVGNSCKAEVVGNVVCKHATLLSNPLVELAVDERGVTENVVEGVVSPHAKDIGKESVVTKVLADIRVVDSGLNRQLLQVRRISDSRELKDLSGADRSSRQNDLFASVDCDDWTSSRSSSSTGRR